MQWHTQARNIATNLWDELDFTLPALIAMYVMSWDCNVDNSDKSRYDIILGQDLLTELILNLKSSEHFIKADYGTFKGSTTPMVDLGKYIFKNLNTQKITPEE